MRALLFGMANGLGAELAKEEDVQVKFLLETDVNPWQEDNAEIQRRLKALGCAE